MADMAQLNKLASEAKARRIAQGLPGLKSPLEKPAENPGSLRLAINAKCYDCIGRDYDPDWRGSIRHCACTDCPLYAVRPFRDLPRETNEDE